MKRSHAEVTGSRSQNPFESAFQDSKRRKVAKSVATATYVARFRRALANFNGVCPICCVQGRLDMSHHPLNQCGSLQAIMPPTDFITFARSIQYGKHHKHPVCFRCHIPQVNDRLHATFDSKGVTCQYLDALVAVAVQVLYQNDTKKEACHYFACNWPEVKDYLAWLNGPPSEGHYSRLSELFLWFSDTSFSSTF